jgi:hypothetical protein
MHMPILGIYNSYSFYAPEDFSNFSLGNMGFSETKCLIESVSKVTS